MLKRRVFLALSVTAWIATSSFANPQALTNMPIQQVQATSAAVLDSHMSQMWDTQQQMIDKLVSHGVVNAADQQPDRHHDFGVGIGGEDDEELSVLSDAKDDHIQQQIDQISRQASERQNKLDKLTASLTLKQTIRKTNPGSINITENALAIEPVANAKVSSPFGYRSMGGRGEYHPGVDLAVPSGTPIHATGAGVVVKAGWVNGYGQFVEIDHGNGLVTRYGHASRILVSVGETVQADQEIATVGCTGRCTGPHVHYEVLKNGQRQNPSLYLALAPKRED